MEYNLDTGGPKDTVESTADNDREAFFALSRLKAFMTSKLFVITRVRWQD